MRVGIMMRDTEYRDALSQMISEAGRDIIVEVAGTGGVHRDAVILTDVMPSEIEQQSLAKLRSRTVFLSSVPVSKDSGKGYHIIFKYSSFTEIMSELSVVYSEWSGYKGAVIPGTRMIAVISGSDQLCSDRCRELAGQIIYIHGGSVLILPLGFINDHRAYTGDDGSGAFRRLMYMIDEGMDYPAEIFTVTDSYGISRLRMPAGINPLTELDEEYLSRLVCSLGRQFDTLVLDIGSCYRKENISLICGADNILFIGSSRRIGNLRDYLGEDAAARAKYISCTDSQDETIALDGYVRDLYGGSET